MNQASSAQPNNGEKSTPFWMEHLLSITSAVVATISLGYALLGYGVSLAIETTFNVSHSMLFASPFELIDLSALAVGELTTRLVGVLGELNFYVDFYARLWPVLSLCAAVWLLATGIAHLVKKPPASAPAAVPPAATQRSFLGVPLQMHAVMAVWLSIGTPLVLLLGVLALALFLSVTALVPIVGMAAGKSYISNWVLSPSHCSPNVSLADRVRSAVKDQSHTTQSIKVVRCVKVLNKEENSQQLMAGEPVLNFVCEA